jgi:hypothetical protein
MAANNRMSISVPEDLKSRMIAEGDGVNWSALACRAFEHKLGELAGRKEVMTLESAVQRLRASKAAKLHPAFKHGVEAGRAWAMGKAGADDLERLEGLYMRTESDQGFANWLHRNQRSVDVNPPGVINRKTNACAIAFNVKGVDMGDDNASPRLNHEVCQMFGYDDSCEEPLFLLGFVESAVQFWRFVKASI